jgi:uncharacterized membrane protein
VRGLQSFAFAIILAAQTTVPLAGAPAPIRTATGPPDPGDGGDFKLDCNPISLTVLQGSEDWTTCTIYSSGGFSEPVALSCANPPQGVTCGFNPNPATPPPDASVDSNLTVSASAAAPPGAYRFLVNATNGSATLAHDLELRVVGPDFYMSCRPPQIDAPQGGSNATTCDVTSSYGFDDNVSFSCDIPPEVASCTFTNPVVHLPANGSNSTVATVDVAAGALPGAYNLDITGSNGTLNRTGYTTLIVAGSDFFVDCWPSYIEVPEGGSNTSDCIVTSVLGFSQPVSLSCPTPPPAITCWFSPSVLTPPPGGQANSTLTLNSTGTPAKEGYEMTVRGTNGTLERDGRITVRVVGPDFKVSCAAAPMDILPGSSNSTACSVTSMLGFSDTVALSCPTSPPGLSCGFVPPSLTPPVNGTAWSTLTIDASAGASAGTQELSVQGNNSTLTRYFVIKVRVLGPDFSVSCSPASINVTQGSSNLTKCTVTSVMGFNGTVSFACMDLKSGLNCDFQPPSVWLPPNGTAETNLTVSANASASPGLDKAIVRAENGTFARATPISRYFTLFVQIVPGVAEGPPEAVSVLLAIGLATAVALRNRAGNRREARKS